MYWYPVSKKLEKQCWKWACTCYSLEKWHRGRVCIAVLVIWFFGFQELKGDTLSAVHGVLCIEEFVHILVNKLNLNTTEEWITIQMQQQTWTDFWAAGTLSVRLPVDATWERSATWLWLKSKLASPFHSSGYVSISICLELPPWSSCAPW